jgi:hypothetical protein
MAIGEYADYGYGAAGDGFGGPYLWNGQLADRVRSVRRSLAAFTGGILEQGATATAQGSMDGYAAAVFFTEAGEAGLVRGGLTGSF